MPKNRTIITYSVTPQSKSTRKRFIQETFPRKDKREEIFYTAKKCHEERVHYMSEENREQRIKDFLSGEKCIIKHTEYIRPVLPVVAIKHNQDIYKSFESFRSNSFEGAKKSLKNRNKDFVVTADFYDSAGNKSSLIQ